MLSLNLKDVSFSLCRCSLFILSHITVDGSCNFFQFDPQIFFFGNLVLIENQLILISYERVRFKEEGPI